MADPSDFLRFAYTLNSRAWFTYPIRRVFFEIMRPFIVYQSALTDAVAHNCQVVGEQVAAVIASEKARPQPTMLDGLRKDSLAVSSRLASLEDAVSQLEDQRPALLERLSQAEHRLADFDDRLHLMRDLLQERDAKAAPFGIATLPREAPLAIAGTTLILHDGPFGRFLLRSPDVISDHVTRGEFWDAHLQPIIEQTGRPDACAIDAGAYLGFHSVYMSHYFGTVYSFEPQVEIYRMLCANLLLNNCHNVIAINGALYDVEGHMRLARPQLQEIPVPWNGTQPAYDAIGNAAALMFELAPEPDDQSVPCRPIDAMGLTTLGLLKVDTQGSDLHVLLGARATIGRCRPTIVAECERELTRAHHHTIDDYRAFFAQIEYDIKVLDDRSSGKQIDFLATPR
jgi:FkbM family methyltransferase